MSWEWVLWGYTRMYWQTADGLLKEDETKKIIEALHSEDFMIVIKKVVDELCSRWEEINFWERELFYVTYQGNIIESLHDVRVQVKDIMTEECSEVAKRNVLMSTVMGIALNELLVKMASEWTFSNISDDDVKNRYRISVTSAWTRKEWSKSYNTQPKSEALRKAFKRRQDLYTDRNAINIQKKAKSGLIKRWILEKTWEWDMYKIANVSRKRSNNHSKALFLSFTSKTGERISMERCTSHHTYAWAFQQIIEEICRIYQLTSIEKSILFEHTTVQHKAFYRSDKS